MLAFILYSLVCLLACIPGSLGTDIVTFTDEKCRQSFKALDAVNGYPDGMCEPLEIIGKVETFQVAKLDEGCVVTLYGPNNEKGLSCSSPLKIVAELGKCYNSSWIYYSIDGCLRPASSTPIILPSATPSSQSTLSISTVSSTTTSSSTSSTPSTSATSATLTPSSDQPSTQTITIIGAIVGTIAICALFIGILLFWLHRRKTRPEPGPPKPPSYELSQERSLSEAGRGSIAISRRVVPAKEVWAHEAAFEMGRNSYAPPVELPAGRWGEDEKRGSGLIRVHMAR